MAPLLFAVIGLSPRVRGNHARRPDAVHRRRSIPACAGEPAKSDLRQSRRGVYPRVCGGTAAICPTAA